MAKLKEKKNVFEKDKKDHFQSAVKMFETISELSDADQAYNIEWGNIKNGRMFEMWKTSSKKAYAVTAA